jgi:rRNA maturation endonuclease Nob1
VLYRVCTTHKDIRLLFAYNALVGFGIQERKLFVVECKRCRRNVAAGVQEFPFQSIVVFCPLCGERRQYLPSDVYLGRLNQLVAKQARIGSR